MVVRTSKRCPRCTETKPIDQFRRPRSGTPSDYCHPCRQAKRKAEYAKAGGGDVSYAQRLMREYGITLADYEQRLALQGGRCKICDEPEPVEGRRLGVDFDKAARLVRGLLCSHCTVVVRVVEDADLVAATQAYLGAARKE